jgi:hypothetical protein
MVILGELGAAPAPSLHGVHSHRIHQVGSQAIVRPAE